MRTSKYFSDGIILIFAVCVVLSFLCQIFKFTAPVNILYIISLLLVLACYVLSGYLHGFMLCLAGLILLAAVANGFRANEMDYYTHAIITLCIFICIEVSSYVKIKLRTFKIIANMFLITSLILLVAYYLGPLKTTYFDYEIGSISLNFPNPNAAGLWLACIFIILLYSSFLFKRSKQLLFIAVAFAILPIILATQSRNSFLACIFFVFGIIAVRVFKIKRIPNWTLLALAILPLIVFAFYMFVIVENMGFWESLFAMDSIDKGLGSRAGVWQHVVDNFYNCFLLGDYYRFYDSQMHNSLLTIFCRFGAPATVLSCVLMYQSLKRLQDNSSLYAAISLGAIFFTGCFEASVFVGIAGMYLMLLLIPACASAEIKTQD